MLAVERSNRVEVAVPKPLRVSRVGDPLTAAEAPYDRFVYTVARFAFHDTDRCWGVMFAQSPGPFCDDVCCWQGDVLLAEGTSHREVEKALNVIVFLARFLPSLPFWPLVPYRPWAGRGGGL